VKLESLAARIKSLELNCDVVALDDGTKAKFAGSGLHLMFNHIKLRRDLGREPKLSDFPEKDHEEWRKYAKWSPDPTRHGQISVLLAGMAKKIAGMD
jgi:hypothetical protein